MTTRTKHLGFFILIMIAISIFSCVITSISSIFITTVTNGVGQGANKEIATMGDISTDSKKIKTDTYVQDDNSGYYSNVGKISSTSNHPLRSNYIDLSVSTEAEYAVAKIDQGRIPTVGGNSVDGYGITGRQAVVKLKYNIPKTSDIVGQTVGHGSNKWKISSDTNQNIGEFKNIGVVGTGAMIVQKSYDGKTWEWQDKDGTSHSQLHTFNFTDTVPPSEYNGENAYTLYTPSGEDLGRGIYLKFKYCYEIANTDTWTEKALGFMWNVNKSKTYYKNIIEEATVYMVQNSGTVLFHNASNFGTIGDEDGTGAFTANDLETIGHGDSTLNGFRLDTMGVDAYNITYKKDGGNVTKATNGQFFLEHGRYDFTIERKFGTALKHTVFINRSEPNDAARRILDKKDYLPLTVREYTLLVNTRRM